MATITIYIIIAYLIGSLSPGYFFGKLKKGIDIREYENKNTGAANTYRLVGPAYGMVAGIFDALKALAAYFIAINGLPFLGLSPINPDFAILAGTSAVAGHIWPFYLKFRGGRGAASLAGLGIITVFYTQSWYALVFITAAIIYGMIFNQVPFEAFARKILKIGGLVFPLGLLGFDKILITNIIGWLLVMATCIDVLRFIAPGFNLKYLKLSSLAKSKERKFLSGYTLFLAGVFVVLKYFPPEIAIFSVSAFIIADILAPAGKEAFLPIPLIKDKTVGGAIVVFTSAVIVGIFLNSLSPLSFPIKLIFSGAAVMAMLDQLSFIIDDNILVPIGAAIVLTSIF